MYLEADERYEDVAFSAAHSCWSLHKQLAASLAIWLDRVMMSLFAC